MASIRTSRRVLSYFMAWSPPALERRLWFAEQAGDYTPPRFPPPPQTLPVMAHGHVLPDDTALNLLFLVLNLAAKEWRMRAKERTAAKIQLTILFKDRFATN